MQLRLENPIRESCYYFLVIYCFFRPFSLMRVKYTIGGLSFYQLFSIGFMYLFILLILLNIRNIKFDTISFLCLIFCLYCLMSISWNSQFMHVGRIIFPFLVFLITKSIIENQKQILVILVSLIVGQVITILLSVIDISFIGTRVRVDYLSKIERYSGVFNGPHGLAYCTLFFNYFYMLFMRINKNRIFFYFLTSVLPFAFYCLYKSGTRTAMVGLLIYWSTLTILAKEHKIKKIFAFCLVIIVLLINIDFATIFWKDEERDLDKASSGRTAILMHNINVFRNSSFERNMLGYGFGNLTTSFDEKDKVWSPHNDYLELLMSGGVICLLIYLTLLLYLFKELLKSNVDFKLKTVFISVYLSVSIINVLSNATVFRSENAQYFWLIMAIFYCYKEKLYNHMAGNKVKY